MDEKITLRKQDKIPYGTYVAYHHLAHLFPDAAIYADRREPGYWDSLSNNIPKQAFIAITGRFYASKAEMKKLISFAENGNDVFVSARYLSQAADDILGCSSSSSDLSKYSDEEIDDSMGISLSDPPFGKNREYDYPGKKFSSYFDKIDSTTTDVLGYDEQGHPNFIHLRAGKGNFYIQLEPLAFSNYFLLHNNNIGYYEKALSVIKQDVTKVVWDEYYLYKRSGNDKDVKKKYWLNILLSYPPLKTAMFTAVIALLVYVLLEMRRKQRYIPFMATPKNDSLDFVKTVGRLYYDKGDHKDLCRKMAAYFLEHVRNRYKLSTVVLDDAFVKNLQFKTGAEEFELRGIISFIKYLDDVPAVNQNMLINFHKQLESFYKKA